MLNTHECRRVTGRTQAYLYMFGRGGGADWLLELHVVSNFYIAGRTDKLYNVQNP